MEQAICSSTFSVKLIPNDHIRVFLVNMALQNLPGNQALFFFCKIAKTLANILIRNEVQFCNDLTVYDI